MRKSIIIEGFGLPGAGKSTCMAMLKVHPQRPKYISIYSRKEGDAKLLEVPYPNKKRKVLSEFYRSTSYLVLRPSFFLSVIRSTIIFRFNKHFLAVLRILIEALYSRSKLNLSDRENRSIILDEGLIQYLGSLVVNTPTNKQVPNKIIKHILSNYISAMIYFDVDYENAIARIKKRNDRKSRFDTMNRENAFLNLNKMEKSFTLCIEMARSLHIPVLKLKNGNSIDKNIDLAITFLNELQLKEKQD